MANDSVQRENQSKPQIRSSTLKEKAYDALQKILGSAAEQPLARALEPVLGLGGLAGAAKMPFTPPSGEEMAMGTMGGTLGPKMKGVRALPFEESKYKFRKGLTSNQADANTAAKYAREDYRRGGPFGRKFGDANSPSRSKNLRDDYTSRESNRVRSGAHLKKMYETEPASSANSLAPYVEPNSSVAPTYADPIPPPLNGPPMSVAEQAEFANRKRGPISLSAGLPETKEWNKQWEDALYATHPGEQLVGNFDSVNTARNVTPASSRATIAPVDMNATPRGRIEYLDPDVANYMDPTIPDVTTRAGQERTRSIMELLKRRGGR